MINSVLALGFDDTKFNWADLTPIAVEHKKLSSENESDVNKAIDANTSVIGIYASHDIVLASGLIGAFLTIDAASLLGKSSVGNDDQWVKDAGALRDLLRITRTLKSEPKEVITQTLGENAYAAFNALIASASRQTKTILVGPGAIALGFVALRSNSKLKDYLLVANTPIVPAITEAIKFMGSKTIMNTKENVHPLAELALAVSALKASEL
ncbi:MAG: nicotinate-nucleotide--dimethylbenzimidazole phosphoribosyltransferase [Actinomycetes bacterium]